MWVFFNKSPKSFIINYISIKKKVHKFGDFFFKWSVTVPNELVKIWCVGLVKKNFQPIFNINLNYFCFFLDFEHFSNTIKKVVSQNFNVFFFLNNEEKGSFLVCWFFFHPFLKKNFTSWKLRFNPIFCKFHWHNFSFRSNWTGAVSPTPGTVFQVSNYTYQEIMFWVSCFFKIARTETVLGSYCTYHTDFPIKREIKILLC